MRDLKIAKIDRFDDSYVVKKKDWERIKKWLKMAGVELHETLLQPKSRESRP